MMASSKNDVANTTHFRYGYSVLDSPAQRAVGVPRERSGVAHPSLTRLAASLTEGAANRERPLYFATDEDNPGGSDPYVATYDQSAEPLEYFADTLELVYRLLRCMY